MVYLTPELAAFLTAHVERVQALSREIKQAWLLPHFAKPHRGRQRRDFRKAWPTACTQAGYPGMLRHDSGGRRCGTWSTGASRSGWPRPSPATRPAPCSTATTSSDGRSAEAARKLANPDGHNLGHSGAVLRPIKS